SARLREQGGRRQVRQGVAAEGERDPPEERRGRGVARAEERAEHDSRRREVQGCEGGRAAGDRTEGEREQAPAVLAALSARAEEREEEQRDRGGGEEGRLAAER